MKATATMGPEGFRTEIHTGQSKDHILIADEPEGKGTDDGPTPIEMLAAAIASCTTLTLRSYANLKEIKIDGVDVDVEIIRKKPSEVKEGEHEMLIRKKVTIKGDLEPKVHDRMMQIADKCSVMKALVKGVDVEKF